MMDKMWIYNLVTAIVSFFFVLIYSKGYEGKGIMEGVRYGLYVGVMLSVGMAYGSYAMIAIPYSLAMQWFLFGMVEYVVAGAVASLVYGKKEGAAA